MSYRHQNTQYDIKFITISAMLSAIVFIATYMVQIPLPGIATGGLIHLGNVALFTIAILFGKKYGAVSGALGMTLFDVVSGWAIWAPGTFIIRGIMGYMIGAISENSKSNKIGFFKNMMAMILSSTWMIFGYFVYNYILYQDIPAAVASLPGDFIQVGVGIAITLPIISTVKVSGIHTRLNRYVKPSHAPSGGHYE